MARGYYNVRSGGCSRSDAGGDAEGCGYCREDGDGDVDDGLPCIALGLCAHNKLEIKN